MFFPQFRWLKPLGFSNGGYITPWKFNIAPENIPSQKKTIVFQPSFFRGYVKLRECNTHCFHGGWNPREFTFPFFFESRPTIRPSWWRVFRTFAASWIWAVATCLGSSAPGWKKIEIPIAPLGKLPVAEEGKSQLGGGFKDRLFSSLLGGRFPFWLIFFKWLEPLKVYTLED